MIRALGLSDHDGVLLSLADPLASTWMMARKKAYPPPVHCGDAVLAECTHLLQLEEKRGGMAAIQRWDALKTELQIASLRIPQAAHNAQMNGARRRTRRLKATLAGALRRLPPDPKATVDSITTGLE